MTDDDKTILRQFLLYHRNELGWQDIQPVLAVVAQWPLDNADSVASQEGDK